MLQFLGPFHCTFDRKSNVSLCLPTKPSKRCISSSWYLWPCGWRTGEGGRIGLWVSRRWKNQTWPWRKEDPRLRLFHGMHNILVMNDISLAGNDPVISSCLFFIPGIRESKPFCFHREDKNPLPRLWGDLGWWRVLSGFHGQYDSSVGGLDSWCAKAEKEQNS